MTPTRETIARAICQDIELHGRGSGYVGDDSDLSDVCIDANCDLLSAADAVLRALDAAGLVVVPRDPTLDMKKAGVEAMCDAERDARAQASSWPNNDFQRGAVVGATLACNSVNLDAAYRAMIAAAPDAG